MHRSPAQTNLFPSLSKPESPWSSDSSLRKFDLGGWSSSSSSEFGEHLSLFHKLDYLKKSPLAGMYHEITHSSPSIQVERKKRLVKKKESEKTPATVFPRKLVRQHEIGHKEEVEIIAKDTESDRFQPIDDINHVHFAPILSVPSNQVPNQTSPVFGLSNNQHLITPSNTMPAQPSSRTTTQMNYPAETIIIEQPASKALRFRYECEGRSAGSIPGVKSTPENKTYPTIQVRGYQGRAVVVVSCVTKDPPHRPHPHNLVGKEGCKKGVCTLEINNKDMTVSFSNLGIQCVKKRDIEDALKQREEIRVDPFRTGFSHKTQPSSVDLNVVRLCFQVFLEGDKGKFTRPLAPVVSEPIYDKKAMSDLVICKLSDCSCPVTGNRDMILLCEKVAKEDIAVKFYEEQNGQVVWEAFGDFQHSAVHKQVAIAFKIPPYKTTQVKQPVECFIQLVRPSDGVVSEPLRFNYTPIEGKPRFQSLREDLKRMANIDIFEQILVNNSSEAAGHLENNNNNDNFDHEMNHEDENNNNNDFNLVLSNHENTNHNTKQGDEVIELLDTPLIENQNQYLEDDDKTLNDLLEQVAELDEIYTDHQIRRDNTTDDFIENELRRTDPQAGNMPVKREGEKMDVDFDDAATYSSLQKAFKNPIDITIGPPIPQRPLHGQLMPESAHDGTHTYDAVDPSPVVVNATVAPKIDLQPMLKRENCEQQEKLPPLPPKRARKLPDSDQIQSDKENESVPELTSTQSQILIKNAENAPNKKLPLPPSKNGSTTLPRPKKPGFFSKLFSRKKSKSDINTQTPSTTAKTTPAVSREPSVNAFDFNDPHRESFRSLRNPLIEDLKEGKSPSKGKVGKPVGRSVSSVSGKRPNLGPEIIHIPLKGDSTNSLPQSNPNLNAPRQGQHSGYGSASTISLHALDKDRKTVSALQLADLPLKDGNMELVAIADAQSIKNLCEGDFGVQLDPDVNLSEAEHYALYTSIPPFATMSEIDENSMYYAQVEGEFRGKKRPRMSGDTTDMFHKVLEQIPPDDRNPYRNISPAGPSVKAEPRETPSPFIPVQHYGGSMYENYRTNQTTPSPQPPTLQPQQPLPFSLSPQPTIPTHFTTNQFPQAFQQDPTFHQIASQLPPLIGNYITPVPMDIQSQQLHQIQQPGPLPPQAQMLPNQNNPTNNNNNPFQQDSINNIEPLDYFQINSSEIRNLLNDGNFSTLNSGQQQQNVNPRAQDPDEECISDSLNKIL
uniref:CSON015181 protein n=1 Tax=Culicoides sonorensis TaxID=179676 RepID=A0A336K2P2_CULSO